MKKAKKKARAKQPGNGWGVMLKSGKLRTHYRSADKETYTGKRWTEELAKTIPGARAVRVQVEPVEAQP